MKYFVLAAIVICSIVAAEANAQVCRNGVCIQTPAVIVEVGTPVQKYTPVQKSPVQKAVPGDGTIPLFPRRRVEIMYPIQLQPGDVVTERRIGIFGWRRRMTILRTQ